MKYITSKQTFSSIINKNSHIKKTEIIQKQISKSPSAKI